MAVDGGHGGSWAAGDIVVKPADRDEAEIEWEAALFASIRRDGFRVAPPRRALDGRFAHDGWVASERVAGYHKPGCWAEIIAVGEKFHAALAAIRRPAAIIDARTDRWAVGDRVAWGELPAADFVEAAHISRLATVLRPVEASSQVIHGDLTGNVLFEPGLPPAIIDFVPRWRPAGFAAAVVVADALVWEGADKSLLDAVSHIPELDQFFVRALIYRLVADSLNRVGEPPRPPDADPYRVPVELAIEVARR